MLNPDMLEEARKSVAEFHELIRLGFINKTGEFVSVHMYPPMMQHPPMKGGDIFKGYIPRKNGQFAVYAHIPFCIQQCAFCYYPNVIGASENEKDAYLDCMDREMGICLQKLGMDRLKARSILLGGGTPTHMSPAQMKRFLGFFTSRLDMSAMTQFGCDLDPLTMLGYEGRERMRILRGAGVSRLALGAQSFSDAILKKMGRHHNNADNIRAIGVAKEMGFKLNLELICDYPGETPEQFLAIVKQAMSLDVDEIMIYRLKIIPCAINPCAINKLLDSRPDPLSSNDEQIAVKSMARDTLRSGGYRETLTRVFSKTAADYSHYAKDYMGDQYDTVGFGYYAMCQLHDRFCQSTYDLKEYCRELEAGRLPIMNGLIRSRDQQFRRSLLMPLKGNLAVSKEAYRERTGTAMSEVFGKKIDLLKKYGLLEEDAEFLKATEKGRFYADEIAHFFFHPDLMPFPREQYADGPLNPYNDNETMN